MIWPIGSNYSRIYCNGANTCSITDAGNPGINIEDANGGTLIVSALREAKLYLDANKAADSAKDCRQKFVILVTDGMDTFSCGGSGTEFQSTQYQRRRDSVGMAKTARRCGLPGICRRVRCLHARCNEEYAQLDGLLRQCG